MQHILSSASLHSELPQISRFFDTVSNSAAIADPRVSLGHKIHRAFSLEVNTIYSIQRRRKGAENWVGLYKESARGQYDFYILLKATPQDPLTLATLRQRLVHDLLKERYEHLKNCLQCNLE